MLFSLSYGGKTKLAKRLGKLSRAQVPVNALFFSATIIAIVVLLNFFIPGKVFTLISSIATTCFLFIWGSIVLTHIKYKRATAAGQAKQVSFKMPWAPYSDYFVLLFLTMVCIILLFRFETLVALIGSVLWLCGLWLFKTGMDRSQARKLKKNRLLKIGTILCRFFLFGFSDFLTKPLKTRVLSYPWGNMVN